MKDSERDREKKASRASSLPALSLIDGPVSALQQLLQINIDLQSIESRKKR